jgi:hypothetical protein
VSLSDGLRYGAGLPRFGVRPLTEHERQAVRRSLRGAGWRLAILGLLVATGVGGAISLRSVLDPLVVDDIGGTPGVAVGITGLLGAAGCLALARGVWRAVAVAAAIYLLAVAGLATLVPGASLPHPIATWIVAAILVALGNVFLAIRGARQARLVWHRRRIRADLARGEVEQFAGQLPASVDPALRRAVGRGELVPGTGPHRLDALPSSGLILGVDGRMPSLQQLAYVVDIAPTQPHAFRASLPDGLAPANEDVPVHLQRRSLTPAERDELAAHIRRLRRQYRPALLVTLSLFIVVGWELQAAGSWRGLVGGTCVAWYVLAAFSWTGYVRRIRAAGKLALDRELRWVVTVDDAGSSPEPNPPRLEVLPISQLAWTENATPATWRIARL